MIRTDIYQLKVKVCVRCVCVFFLLSPPNDSPSKMLFMAFKKLNNNNTFCLISGEEKKSYDIKTLVINRVGKIMQKMCTKS